MIYDKVRYWADKENYSVVKRFFCIVLMFFCIVFAAGEALPDEPSRVVIVPFEIHADKDLSFLKAGIVNMLTSRLSSDGKVVVVAREDASQVLKDVSPPFNEKKSRTIGDRLQADYVLFGSLTIFGNSISLDGKMVDVHQKRPTLAFFKQGNEIDEVIPQINLFAVEIKEKVFGRPVAIEPELPKTRERADIYAHPETLLAEEASEEASETTSRATSEEAKASGLEPVPVAAEGGFAETRDAAAVDISPSAFWKSKKFKTTIKGIALGDVDGDGKTEVVFISKRRVYVYRLEDKTFTEIDERAGKRYQRFIGVDVADINGNGCAEIFVTSLKGTGQVLDSFVLEWDGHDFQTVSEGDHWYYRVIDMPGQGKVLIGQKRTMVDLFVPGVYRLAWRNGEYGAEERVELPKKMNVFGFALGDVMNNGQQMVVAFDKSDYICLFSRSGEEEWKSDKRYGGSMNYLEYASEGGEDNLERLYLPQRIFVRDLDGDGRQEVVVASNQGTFGHLLAHFRKFTSGRMASLLWQGSGLTLTRETPKLTDRISDCAIGDFDNDGKDEVVVAHVGKSGLPMLGSTKSSIIGYEIMQPLSASSASSVHQ